MSREARVFFQHSYVVSGIDTEYAEGLVWTPWCSWLCHRGQVERLLLSLGSTAKKTRLIG